MKTSKKIKIAIWTMLLVACVWTCASPHGYKMTTKIHKDGSCERIARAKTPCTSVKDTALNPFWFALTPDWKVEYADSALLDSALHAKNIDIGFDLEINAKRMFKKIGDYCASLQCEDEMLSPLLKPTESLKKQFKWFYTDYFFTAKYPNISDKLPVSPNQYIAEKERKLWLQGDLSNYQGLTGWELKIELENIERKFNLFLARIYYENAWQSIDSIKRKLSDTAYLCQMNLIKDTLFSIYAEEVKKDKNPDIYPKNVCKLLDNSLKTNYFFKLYKENEEEFKQMSEQKEDFYDLFFQNFQYDLIMPGKVIFANTPFDVSDTLSWEIDAFRFLTDDYMLEAQSRSINIWAFVLTFLAGGLLVFCFVKWKFCIRKIRLS
jgi:hypothetical protein